MIACDAEPYLVVERQGFRNLIHVLNPRYKIPSREMFSKTVVPNIYEEIRSKVSVINGEKETN